MFWCPLTVFVTGFTIERFLVGPGARDRTGNMKVLARPFFVKKIWEEERQRATSFPGLFQPESEPKFGSADAVEW